MSKAKSSYAKYIGRVGALAVVLGVGVAVANAPGIAWAEGPNETGASAENAAPSSSTDSKTPPSTANSATDSSSAGVTSPDGDTTDGGPVTTKAATGSQTTTVISDGDAPKVTFSHSGGADRKSPGKATSPLVEAASDAEAPKLGGDTVGTATVGATDIAVADVADDDVERSRPARSSAPISTIPRDPQHTRRVVPPASLTVNPTTSPLGVLPNQNGAASPVLASMVGGAVTDPTPASLGTSSTTLGPEPVRVPDPISELMAAGTAWFVNAVNATVDFFQPIVGPGAPNDNPLLWTLLVWAKRETNRNLANQTPTLNPVFTGQYLDNGIVSGTFGAADGDGDVLAYVVPTSGVGAPAHGTVSIDQATGTWTYTPNAGYIGADSFTVIATDALSAPHTHLFGGLNQLTFGLLGDNWHSTAATITVNSGLRAGLERTEVLSQFHNGAGLSVDFEFLPDGRILLAEKNGGLVVFDPESPNTTLKTLITLPVAAEGEQGIGGIEVDPSFTTNGYIYVSYSSTAERDRLSRFTITGDTIAAASEKILMQSTLPDSINHHAGDLHFGPDGKLYWSVGDNEFGANAQDLSNIHGKILRLNTDGTAPADNPFVNLPGAIPQIYAYGFRNPFRFAFTPNGKLLAGDVGESSWEELDHVLPGWNYGWPVAEGPCATCISANPIYAYPHVPPNPNTGEGGAISAVLVYTGDAYGESEKNKVFIGDYSLGWIRELTFNSDYTTLISDQMFDDRAEGTVKMVQGPDGNIYTLSVYGEISRITPTNGNGTPTAVILAAPTSGYLDPQAGGFAVQFASAGSSDPENQLLSAAWDFGDGTTSAQANPVKVYTANGAYNVTLTVTDPQGKSGVATQRIVVGSTAPVIAIVTPSNNALYSAGDTISFSGAAADPDEVLPDSAYVWTVVFHHADHTHPFLDNLVGKSGSFVIPRDPHNSADTFYRITLTVTDSSGLSTTRSVDVKPRLVTVTFNANNPQATYTIDGIPRTGSYTEQAVVGVQRTLGAPSPQTVSGGQLVFNSWSDGGAQTHTIITPGTNTSYTVTYNLV